MRQRRADTFARAHPSVLRRRRVPKLGLPLRLIYAEELNPLGGTPPGDEQPFDRFSFSVDINF